ncbi:lasso peptide biosynthesis B2 protein [Chitinophaga sp. 22536]|uniref:lasso peptide biosynthesis B2 protein n=1 Tax=unclassified Chitinophaga TaxID=2619133 RepID=UPI003F85F7B6
MYPERDLIAINRSIRSYDQLFFRIRAMTVVTEAILRFTSLKTTEKLLSLLCKNVPPPNERDTMIILDKYATLFHQLNQLPFLKGRCLSRSLVMRCLLSRKGIPAELKIGIQRRGQQFDAHAWLEKDGKLLNDHPAVIAQYIVLPENNIKTILAVK